MPLKKAQDQLDSLKAKNKDQSCILFNHAGFEWEIILNGEIYRASVFKEERNTVAIDNDEGATNPKHLKKMMIAVLKVTLEDNIDSINQLIQSMNYGEELEYNNVVDLLKLKTYELTELEYEKVYLYWLWVTDRIFKIGAK